MEIQNDLRTLVTAWGWAPCNRRKAHPCHLGFRLHTAKHNPNQYELAVLQLVTEGRGVCGEMREKKEKGKDSEGRNSLLSNGAVKKIISNVTKC